VSQFPVVTKQPHNKKCLSLTSIEMHGQFKYQPERRCNSSTTSKSFGSKKQSSSTSSSSDRVAAKIRRGNRQRSEEEDPRLSSAYCGLFLLAAVVAVVLAGDSFFVHLYSSILEDATPPELLPAAFHPLTYNDCLTHERLLDLRILSPADEELTANPQVSMTVHGDFFRAASSRGQLREALVRVRLDDEDLSFPGGNNMTIPLDDRFDLAFDLSYFGFGRRKAPYKLTAEIFVPLLSSDVHYAEAASVNKHTLTSLHTVYFFYIPIAEAESEVQVAPAAVAQTEATAQGNELLRQQHYQKEQELEQEVATPTGAVSTHTNADVGDASSSGESVEDAVTGPSAPPATKPITVEGPDAFPGFRFSKMLSLSYRGGCTGGAAPQQEGNVGAIKLGFDIHPQ
jgi:hypothetical protein